jgi:hypothetical protein
MGGDKAPAAILKGCWEAAPLLDDKDIVYLVGDRKIIEDGLAASELPADKKRLLQESFTRRQVIDMDDSPVEAIRGKPDSSISVMCKLAAKGEADVVISAGNTGACVAAAQLRMRTLPGVSRPGIAIILPTFHGPGHDLRRRRQPGTQGQAHRAVRDDGRRVFDRRLRHREPARRAAFDRRGRRQGQLAHEGSAQADARRAAHQLHRQRRRARSFRGSSTSLSATASSATSS